MTDHTILCLDFGSTVGWALIKNAVVVQSGVRQLSAKDAQPGHRFVMFQDEILRGFTKVDEIVYEDIPFHTSRDQSRVYDGLLAHLQAHCLRNRIRLLGINNSTIKKEFAGNGKASKEEMCAHAHSLGWRHGEPGTDLDHDECDAIAAGFVRLSRQGITARFK